MFGNIEEKKKFDELWEKIFDIIKNDVDKYNVNNIKTENEGICKEDLPCYIANDIAIFAIDYNLLHKNAKIVINLYCNYIEVVNRQYLDKWKYNILKVTKNIKGKWIRKNPKGAGK